MDIRYNCILKREEKLARAIARSAVPPKSITVWEVLIPFLLIFTFMKLKEDRERAAQNILFTKKLALEGARDMIRNSQSRKTVIDRIKTRTHDLLTRENNAVYTEEIRDRQLEEIKILIDHYCRLLSAGGNDYPTLVIETYGQRADYVRFTDDLTSAENAVVSAARQSLGERADRDTANRIQAAAKRFRTAELDRIFGPQPGDRISRTSDGATGMK